MLKDLFAVAIVAFLVQHPAQASSDFATVNAGLLVSEPAQIENNYLLLASISEPVAINSVSTVFALDEALVFIDPVGPQEQYRRFGRPDIVVLTSVYPSHLSIYTMIGLLRRDTVVLAPQAVIDQLPLMISNNVITPFETGMAQEVFGILLNLSKLKCFYDQCKATTDTGFFGPLYSGAQRFVAHIRVLV